MELCNNNSYTLFISSIPYSAPDYGGVRSWRRRVRLRRSARHLASAFDPVDAAFGRPNGGASARASPPPSARRRVQRHRLQNHSHEAARLGTLSYGMRFGSLFSCVSCVILLVNRDETPTSLTTPRIESILTKQLNYGHLSIRLSGCLSFCMRNHGRVLISLLDSDNSVMAWNCHVYYKSWHENAHE